MKQTFDFSQAAELAVIERSGFIESRHAGSAVVTDPAGQALLTVGAPEVPIMTRSCLKPLQALAVMTSGVTLDGPQAVLATASHVAEKDHVETVQSMLERGNLSEQDLQCPSAAPADPEYAQYARTRGQLRSRLHFNCSGKHAAFLLAQVANDQPTESYLDPDSLIQRRVKETVTEFCEEAPAHTGIDGCGAPVHALSLTGLARGICKVAAGVTPEATALTRSVLENPWGIQGHGKANSVTIEELGVFAKFGAEGVIVIATRDGHCAAVKTLDGAHRANSYVALSLLAHAGALRAEDVLPVIERVTPDVTGGALPDGSPAVAGSTRSGAGLAAVLAGQSGAQAGGAGAQAPAAFRSEVAAGTVRDTDTQVAGAESQPPSTAGSPARQGGEAGGDV